MWLLHLLITISTQTLLVLFFFFFLLYFFFLFFFCSVLLLWVHKVKNALLLRLRGWSKNAIPLIRMLWFNWGINSITMSVQSDLKTGSKVDRLSNWQCINNGSKQMSGLEIKLYFFTKKKKETTWNITLNPWPVGKSVIMKLSHYLKKKLLYKNNILLLFNHII